MSRCGVWPALVRGTLLLLAVGVCVPVPTVARAGVVAVCADGSMILAKKSSDVNCAGAVEVEPDDVPPIGSGIRPRPIARANVLRKQDISSPPSPSARPSLTMISGERRDLALLVDLSQRDTPAVLEHTHAGDTTAVLQIAHSRAFETKLRARQRAVADFPSGPILVFSLEPANADLVATHLSFSQRGRGFRPGTGDPRELGWIDGDDAKAGSSDRRLGYIVLPEFFEVSRPLAVFWGEAVVGTTLRR